MIGGHASTALEGDGSCVKAGLEAKTVLLLIRISPLYLPQLRLRMKKGNRFFVEFACRVCRKGEEARRPFVMFYKKNRFY